MLRLQLEAAFNWIFVIVVRNFDVLVDVLIKVSVSNDCKAVLSKLVFRSCLKKLKIWRDVVMSSFQNFRFIPDFFIPMTTENPLLKIHNFWPSILNEKLDFHAITDKFCVAIKASNQDIDVRWVFLNLEPKIKFLVCDAQNFKYH